MNASETSCSIIDLKGWGGGVLQGGEGVTSVIEWGGERGGRVERVQCSRRVGLTWLRVPDMWIRLALQLEWFGYMSFSISKV